MKLSDDQQEQVLRWLHEHWGEDPICPFCKGNDWGIADRVFGVMEGGPQGMFNLAGASIPLVPVTCSTCGYTAMVNALVTGVVTKRAEERDTQAPSPDRGVD
jgi:hypothetical protein